MLLKAEKITKSYQQTESNIPILTGVDLEIAQGERVAIMGPSGSGKSTLLSILACLDRPDSGTLQICDQDVSKLDAFALNHFRARNIGIIFQNFHLLPKLTAAENIRLPVDFLGLSNATQRVDRILESLGLSARRNHFPNQMSRGECQRVAIGRVLVTQPKLVFADEPTGSLDIRTANQIIDLLKTHLPADCGFIMVTHDPRLAETCSKVYRLNDGQLKYEVSHDGTSLGL